MTLPCIYLTRIRSQIRIAEENMDISFYVDRIPNTYLKDSKAENGYQTNIYQLELLHREFASPLNVVIIVKTNLKNLATSHVILFSSDLNLGYDKLIDYYSLRASRSNLISETPSNFGALRIL